MTNNPSCIITIEDSYQTKGKPPRHINMNHLILYVTLICSLVNLMFTLQWPRRTMKEQKNIDDMNKILKDVRNDLRNVTKRIENYDRNLNNYNVTTHDVSAMAGIKIGYDFIYSTLEKIFDKGAAPSKLIHQNGSQDRQTLNNGTQIHQTHNYNIKIVNGNNAIQTKSKLRRLIENSTHVTWQRFVDDSSPLPASEPSNTTVSQEEP